MPDETQIEYRTAQNSLGTLKGTSGLSLKSRNLYRSASMVEKEMIKYWIGLLTKLHGWRKIQLQLCFWWCYTMAKSLKSTLFVSFKDALHYTQGLLVFSHWTTVTMETDLAICQDKSPLVMGCTNRKTVHSQQGVSKMLLLVNVLIWGESPQVYNNN